MPIMYYASYNKDTDLNNSFFQGYLEKEKVKLIYSETTIN